MISTFLKHRVYISNNIKIFKTPNVFVFSLYCNFYVHSTSVCCLLIITKCSLLLLNCISATGFFFCFVFFGGGSIRGWAKKFIGWRHICLSLIGIILRWGFLIWELIFIYCGLFPLILVVFVLFLLSLRFGQISPLAFFRWFTSVPGEHCQKIAVSNPTQAGQRFTW